jgi:Lrp/AsnC family leucine-responsive transcriptional regulator
MEKNRLDRIDLRILDVLQENGRITNAQLAGTVGLSPSRTLERVRRLEQRGVIRKYVALVDPEALDRGTLAYVQVSLSAHDEQAILRFIEAVNEIPEVLECHHIAGDFDFLLKVRVKNIPEYQKFTLSRLSSLEGTRTFGTYFVLGTEKFETSLPIPE